MANLFSSEAPHIHILAQFCTILLVVWSANINGVIVLLPRQVPKSK